ncbi:HAD family hydrolase [Geomonas limicola]|uniref:HAD family hydrolase n=1 Tax=Geomonas limicola TaxID=2740186 RepID=UPI0016071F7D|nr:hypothetical protein [Geomonas limicola]
MSFDVFDTVLTRVTAQPKGIFQIMSRCLADRLEALSGPFVENFCAYRIAAERTARNNGVAEVTLREIYQVLAQSHGLDPHLADRIAHLEIELETASVFAVPALKRCVERCRELGKKVIFVSDMYLPGSVVQGMLQKLGLFDSGDTLYISSEQQQTKGGGGLFRVVLEHEGCRPEELWHIGDNRHSDFTVPKALGISAVHVTGAFLTKNEEILLGEGDLAGQYLAGAARLARLKERGPSRADHEALYQLGAALAGPVFVSYLFWIAARIRETGVRRLYFVSRDGQILHELAQVLFRNEDLELRYLYGSRQAWHLPALTEITEQELYWITIADPHLSIRVLAGRLLLDPLVVQEALRADGLDRDVDIVFDDRDIRLLREILVKPGELATRVKARAADLRHDAVGYLRQEGLFDEVPWALVDLGWFGNMQDSLQKMLNETGCRTEVRGFYFGLLKQPQPGKLKHPFLFSPTSDSDRFALGSCFVQIAELFASGDHGSTLCYRNEGSSYAPVLKDRSEWIDDWGLCHLRAGALSFAEALSPDGWHRGSDLRERMFSLMKRLFFTPTPDEALALGQYRFSSDQGETVLRPFAPPLSLGESVSYIRRFGGLDRFGLTFWLHGSRVRSAWHVNLFLTMCSQCLIRYNDLRRWLSASRG